MSLIFWSVCSNLWPISELDWQLFHGKNSSYTLITNLLSNISVTNIFSICGLSTIFLMNRCFYFRWTLIKQLFMVVLFGPSLTEAAQIILLSFTGYHVLAFKSHFNLSPCFYVLFLSSVGKEKYFPFHSSRLNGWGPIKLIKKKKKKQITKKKNVITFVHKYTHGSISNR